LQESGATEQGADDLRIDAFGGVLLITAAGATCCDARRLESHIADAEKGPRTVVLDLSSVEQLDAGVVLVLRRSWRRLGERLRVVATPGGGAAEALKRAGLRRFAIHGTLSGALSQAAA
jgi:hypothetical protein